MALTVDEAYRHLLRICHKNQVESLNYTDALAYLNQAQYDYQDFLLGSPEQFQPGRPVPRVAFGNGEQIDVRLAPFIVRDAALSIASGLATKPSTLRKLGALLKDGVVVRRAETGKLGNWRGSEIDPPSASNPLYTELTTQYQFFPSTMTSVEIIYIRRPVKMVWNFTTVNGRPVYTATNSVHPEWEEGDMYNIIARAARIAGVPYQDSNLQNYGQSVINQGE